MFQNNPAMNYGSSKKCQNCTFKVIFLCQKLTDFFLKKNSFTNINLGDHFFVKTFFSNFNFWTIFLNHAQFLTNFGTHAVICMHLCLCKTLSQDCPHGEIRQILMIKDFQEKLPTGFSSKNHLQSLEKCFLIIKMWRWTRKIRQKVTRRTRILKVS